MAKTFRVTFGIPNKAFKNLRDIIIWNKVKKYSVNQIVCFINKYLDSVPNLKVYFAEIDKNLLGTYDHDEYADWIHLSSNIRIDAVPSVIIHELLHAIFPEIEDDKYILALERKVMLQLKKLSKRKMLNKIMRKVLLNGRSKYADRKDRARDKERYRE